MKKRKSFKHSSSLHNQDALMRLRIELGPAGYGIYLMLVEVLHETGKPIDGNRLDILAYEFHCSPEELSAVVKKFGLFMLTTEGYVTPDLVEPEMEEELPDNPEFMKKSVDEQFKEVFSNDELYSELYTESGGKLCLISKMLKTQNHLRNSRYRNPESLVRAIRHAIKNP